MTVDDPIFRDPRFVQFYDSECGWDKHRSDFDFCVRLAKNAASVLDLGCGTGELTAALAPSRRVTGVDPAAAMLDVARRRPGGDKVQWVEADARTVRLDARFDLIILTGHAFQVFLTESDRLGVLRTIARHLSPEGRFIFDSRNPLFGAWRNWVPDRSHEHLEHETQGNVEVWRDNRHDPETGIVTYRTSYRFESGEVISGEAQIAFPPKEVLDGELKAAGLAVQQWYGDWLGAAWSDESREIIPLGGLAKSSDQLA